MKTDQEITCARFQNEYTRVAPRANERVEQGRERERGERVPHQLYQVDLCTIGPSILRICIYVFRSANIMQLIQCGLCAAAVKEETFAKRQL